MGKADAQQLEEVMVTATKRAESIQDVPMSIEAMMGDDLVSKGIQNLEQLSDTISNVIIGEGVTSSSIAIRGQSTGQDRSLEQSVGMFIDGMYMPRSKQYRSPFFDVERVEVLRGPQAVLFGLNSTAGAINIRTARTHPGENFQASLMGQYEMEYGETRLAATIGGSPTESLGLRLAAEWIDQEEGWFENEFTGDPDDGRNANLIRLSGVWKPTENVMIDAKFEHSELDVPGSTGEAYEGSFDDLDFSRFDDLGSGENEHFDWIKNYKESGMDTESDAFVVNVDWLIGDYTLTAVGGYSEFSFDMVTDFDLLDLSELGPALGTVPGMFHSAIIEDFKQTSFELRLASPEDRTISYIVGAYYQDTDLGNRQPNVVNDISLGYFFGYDSESAPLTSWWEDAEGNFEQNTKTTSVFASFTWNISEHWRATLGARYNDEEKKFTRTGQALVIDPASGVTSSPDQSGCGASGDLPAPDCQFVFFAPTAAGDFERDSQNFMPELIVQWNLSDDAQVYGKVGRSAKAGGFSSSTVVAPDSVVFDAETALAFEVGIRSNLRENRAELNASIFHNTIEDLQVSTFDPISAASTITNAGENVAWGIEMDGKVAANDWLILGGSIAYLDAEYGKFEDGPCGSPDAPDPGGDGRCDMSGLTPPFAPEWSGSVFADASIRLTDYLNLTGGLTVSFSDSYFVEGSLSPHYEQDAWTKLNARIGVASTDEKWEVSLIGTNLTDEITSNYGIELISAVGFPSPPRQLTLQGLYRF
jgi:outer membrane receptor protein involved in Fe transport